VFSCLGGEIWLRFVRVVEKESRAHQQRLVEVEKYKRFWQFCKGILQLIVVSKFLLPLFKYSAILQFMIEVISLGTGSAAPTNLVKISLRFLCAFA